MMKKIAALLFVSAILSAPVMAEDFNGNLCETDINYHCLGLQGISRAEVVKCLRRHMSDLSSECRKVMSDRNFKSHADESAASTESEEAESN